MMEREMPAIPPDVHARQSMVGVEGFLVWEHCSRAQHYLRAERRSGYTW